MAWERINGRLSEGSHASTSTTMSSGADSPPPQTRPLLLLSGDSAEWFAREAARGAAKASLKLLRQTLWSIIEFVQSDSPTRELGENLPEQYLDWLTNVPTGPRRMWALPRDFSAATVKRFLSLPPRRQSENYRNEQTCGTYWRLAKPFFAHVGLDTAVRKEPSCDIEAPWPPTRRAIAAWWQDCLQGPVCRDATAADRRRVVLVQSIIYLTGMRLKETLLARTANIEGRWLLLHREATKSGKPRIIYLSCAALAIIRRLHSERQTTLFDAACPAPEQLVAAWTHSISQWHSLVRACTSPASFRRGEKRHQLLRQKLSNWMARRDAIAESAQLGHGGKGVVYKHYLAVLQTIPRLLESRRLPEVQAPGFAWPPPVDVPLRRPDRLEREAPRDEEPATLTTKTKRCQVCASAASCSPFTWHRCSTKRAGRPAAASSGMIKGSRPFCGSLRETMPAGQRQGLPCPILPERQFSYLRRLPPFWGHRSKP